MVDSTHRAIPPVVANDDGPSERAAVDRITATGMSVFVLGPVFYQNELGAVTKRKQTLDYYEANSIRPIGPYIWSRY
jgi:hypothetical protein